MKNRVVIIVILSVILLILGVVTIFAFKVRGSSNMDLVSGCVPYNVVISREGDYKANISWSTEDDCLGYISYGDGRETLDFLALDIEDLSSRSHTVVIEKLLPSQTYFFVINSGENMYGNKGLPLSFSLSSL
ncbi:MAG: fibronectin type III domain-containing protein [Candidatus Dojkabacteria bacterium]|nr:fibronectin type III domain-containing protein [Candidatus Dojkabacteria bacterium]